MAEVDELVVKLSADIDALRAAMEAATKAVDTASNKMGDAVEDFGDEAKKGFGKALTGFKVFAANLAADVAFAALNGLKNAFVNAAKSALEFDSAISEVNSILPKNEKLTKAQELALINLSSQYGGTPQKQAKAYYQIVSAGVSDTAQAFGLLEQANKASVAGLTDVETAIDGLTNVMAVYGASGIKAADASDILFNAVKQGKTNFELLASNIGKVAPIANAAQISFQDLSGSIAFLTKAGVSTAESMTQLKSLFQGLAAPSDEMKKKAAEMGIELGEAALKSNGLTETMRQIKEATGGSLTEIKQFIPSIEGAAAAAAIAAGDFEDFEKIMASMQTASGSTSDAFKEIEKSASFQFDVLKQELANIPTAMLTLVNGPMAELIKSFREMLPNAVKFATDSMANIIDALAWLSEAWEGFKAIFNGAVFTHMGLIIDEFVMDAVKSFTNLLESLNFGGVLDDQIKQLKQSTLDMTDDLIEGYSELNSTVDTETSSSLRRLSKNFRAIGEEGSKALASTETKQQAVNAALNQGIKLSDEKSKKDKEDIETQTKLLDLAKARAEAETKFAEGLAQKSVDPFSDLEAEAEVLEARNEQRLLKDEEYFAMREGLLLDRYGREQNILDEQLKKGLISQATYNAAVLESDKKLAKGQAEVDALREKEKVDAERRRQRNFNSSLNTIATLQNSSSKELAAIGKAAAIYQATVDGYAAVQKALASAPPPFNFAIAAAVGAATAANVAKISGAQLQQGIDEVPGIGTQDNFPAVLAPGERVVPAETNKDLKNFLNQNESGGKTLNMTVNISAVSQDPDDIVDAINVALDKGSLRLRNDVA